MYYCACTCTCTCYMYAHVHVCTCIYIIVHAQRGCDVDAKNDLGQTPLHMALARGNTRSVERLVEYGASVHAVDLDGCTPLHYATSRDIMEPPSEECPIIFKVLYISCVYICTSYMYIHCTILCMVNWLCASSSFKWTHAHT